MSRESFSVTSIKELESPKKEKKYAGFILKPGIKFYQALCNLTRPIWKYELHIPETYYAEEGKLLFYDNQKECLGSVETCLISEYRDYLDQQAIDYKKKIGDNDALLDEPAYSFCKRISLQNSDFRTRGVFPSFYISIRKWYPGEI